MKKSLLCLITLSTLIFGACNNKSDQPKQDNNISTNASSNKTEKNDLIKPEESSETLSLLKYEGNLLSTPSGDFEFIEHGYFVSDTEVPVVVIRFNYTNTTDENQNIESLLWEYTEPKQVLSDLTTDVAFFIFSEDEPYAEEVSKSQAEIHPGATIQAAYGYGLDNTEAPLTLNFVDENYDVIGSREFPLQ